MKINELAVTAASIIFDNEGSYGSVNKNDNGAVSVGKLQWHGGRAAALLKKDHKRGAGSRKHFRRRALWGNYRRRKLGGAHCHRSRGGKAESDLDNQSGKGSAGRAGDRRCGKLH